MEIMKRNYFLIGLLGVLVLVNVYVWSLVPRTASHLSVSFLNVGQGDAIFIQSPSGMQVLIDGGPPDERVLRSLSRVMPWTDRTIDLIIPTHPDADHIGGLPALLERYEVSHILHTDATADTGIYRAFAEQSSSEGAVVIAAERGQVLDLGSGAYLTVLYPRGSVAAGERNEGSVVARLDYGDTSFLFTGDAPDDIEEYLVWSNHVSVDTDVLKVGHHGSDTSSASAFLSAVTPEYAVISAGCDNRYGHPDADVLERLRTFTANILSTCEEGTVTFTSDGYTVSVAR